MSDTLLLSLIIFLPAVVALVLAVLPLGSAGSKGVALATTFVVCILTFALLSKFLGMKKEDGTRDSLMTRSLATATSKAQAKSESDLIVRKPWITTDAFKIEYYLGVDGISLSLVVLTGVLSFLSMLAAFSIEKYVRGFCVLFLLLETGMMGVFLSLDFFLFYVFWEVMLLPMYFLIGVWGGPRREYAAIKFFLYTLLGSVLILIAMIAFYFTSPTPTFDIMALHKIGQTTGAAAKFSVGFQTTMFVLLFIGFAIKIPSVPFHTWLPDAHVEAPTPISMILAGVLLKMGGYGLIRIAYPICPAGAYNLAMPLACLGSSASSTAAWRRWPKPTLRSWWPTARSATWVTSR